MAIYVAYALVGFLLVYVFYPVIKEMEFSRWERVIMILAAAAGWFGILLIVAAVRLYSDLSRIVATFIQ